MIFFILLTLCLSLKIFTFLARQKLLLLIIHCHGQLVGPVILDITENLELSQMLQQEENQNPNENYNVPYARF